MNARRRSIALTVATALAVALPATASAAATARLHPDQLAAGAAAQLAVTVDGEATQPPALRLPGVDVRFTGQQTQVTIRNGAASRQTTFIYTIIPGQVGALDIPALEVVTGAGVQHTEPIHATVTRDAATPGVAASSGPAPARAQNAAARSFLRLELPAKRLYVGEAVPVKIRAYFRAGTAATLAGPPHPTSDAYIFAELSKEPVQTQVDIRGERYLQATWTAILSTAKPTRDKLRIELPVELAYREVRPRPSVADHFGLDPFFRSGDPFDAFFNGADPFADLESMLDVGPVQRRQLTLRADAGQLTVVEPPVTGRPAGFTGAVGQFELAIDPPVGELRVGEPATVTMRVTGTGNFDRLAAPVIPPVAGVEIYPGKTTFTPAATSKLTGTQTSTQTLVPTRAGELTIPAVTLANFDPARRAYVVRATRPLTLSVAPAPGGGAADPDLASASVRDPAMTPNRVAPGAVHATLQPALRQPRFWALLGVLALATALLAGLGWWRRSPAIAGLLGTRRVDRAVARQLAAMDRAARRTDAAGFFAAARAALQARLGATWQMAPAAVTAADIDGRLGPRGATIRSVFEHADQITYAGAAASAEPLTHWRGVVRDQLAHLETSP